MKIVQGRVRVAASDVANFLACQELTQLDLRAARSWNPGAGSNRSRWLPPARRSD
jgi:hypothetical protein